MVFTGQGRAAATPGTPTLFRGEQIASFANYADAQRAVDYLSDEKFAVQNVAIVGTDLRMVERVTGRLSYPRVALAGALSGAYFGLFVGLLLVLFTASGTAGFAAVLFGLGFGILFAVISYALTRGRRDFTSASQIVATQYAILCAPEVAGEARRVLQGLDGGRGAPPPQVSPAPLSPVDLAAPAAPPVPPPSPSSYPDPYPPAPTYPAPGASPADPARAPRPTSPPPPQP